MKKFICLLLIFSISCYNREKAVAYANQWWNTVNHDCNSEPLQCTPYAYFGSESCGYESQGGDCANFVSQCLLAGEHPKLKKGEHCRGYPCEVEEPGAKRLQDCLHIEFGWESTCGYLEPPPENIQPGDVLVYHAGDCENFEAHATIVVQGAPNVKIACHSSNHYGIDYNYMSDSKPYYNWLHYTG
jgi:hypothetical protein